MTKVCYICFCCRKLQTFIWCHLAPL